MADLAPLLREVNGVYSDRARDRLPNGSVWEMSDFVPLIMQAGVRMRGAWKFQSDALPSPPDGMLYAAFAKGSKLLVAAGAQLYSVPVDSVGSTLLGTITRTIQNPVFHRNRVIIPAADGVAAARYVTYDGAVFTLTNAPVSAITARYATVWKDRVVLGNSATEPQQVMFSKPGDPTVAFDSLSFVNTSYDITGLAGQRSQVLVMHASSVERLRGTEPPDSTLSDKTGDLILDVLFDRAGCFDARSIAYWQDNVLFADERGVYITDGAVVRNMTTQGGISNLWRAAFEAGGTDPISISGGVHRDYYLCTVRHAGVAPTTFVIDIPTRRAFPLSNVDAAAYAFSIGVGENLYGTDQTTFRVTDLTPIFAPDSTVLQVDDDGSPVLPMISTGWGRLTNKPGFKRILEAHLSYLADRDDDAEVLRVSYVNAPTGSDQTLRELRAKTEYTRRPVAVNRRLEGIAIKLEQLLPTKDTRLYDISLRAYAEEASRV